MPLGHARAASSATAPRQQLGHVHSSLSSAAAERVQPLLDAAHARAERAHLGGASGRLAACLYAADVIAGLAIEGELDADDTNVAVRALAEACSESLDAASFDLFLHTVTNAGLLELPPLVAAEVQLRLLVHLDVAAEVTLWRRANADRIECVLSLGAGETSRSVRAEARRALRGQTPLSLLGRSTIRSAPVRRFGHTEAAIVIRVGRESSRDSGAYLAEAAAALSPALEREYLLERSTSRERALVSAGEKRLMRLGFDLHDGPIQDVLVLGAEVRRLRDQVYPFMLESHRELAHGRFDDVLGRLTELDRQLREIAHSLESKSIVSRPLGEILHREVDAFAERSGIDARLELRGDPESLSSAQRIAVFRAIQEALANVREHSGASSVEISLRARRSWIDVRIMDNGQGFEVSRALARAAQRGRMGLVGIGERVRMLGGTFDLESAPGGPTTLRFSLPRW